MKIISFLLVIIAFTTNTALAEVMGMSLRGQGVVRYLGFIKVYDAYLYTHQSHETKDILAANVSKCLKLDYAVSLSPNKIITSANTILKSQHVPERLQQVKAQIDRLNNAYQAVRKGDQYRLCYDAPTATTTLLLNDKPLVAVPSAEFGQIYFGIWLGPQNPIDADLRNDLLNQANR